MGLKVLAGFFPLLRLVACITVHAQPPPIAELPPHLLETWELAAADAASRHESSTRRLRRQPIEEPDPAVMNLTKRGICYPAPLEATVRENWFKVQANFDRGKEAAKNKTIVFAGLVRNAGPAVRSAYLMLSRIGALFQDYHFILLENDSDDDTAEQLERIQKEDAKFSFRSYTLGMSNARGLEASRMQRMAQLRNMLHEQIRIFFQQEKSTWDLVVMYDFDLNLFGDHVVSPHGFFGVLGRPISMWDKWDMVCANSLRHHDADPGQEIGYHDCFAYRPTNNDAFNGGTCGNTMARTMFTDFHPFKVHSCFGGLAIYKAKSFLGCRYDGKVYDCEHVPFHKCMREHGSEQRMFLDPLLTTLYDSNIPQLCRKYPSQIPGYKYDDAPEVKVA